MDTTGIDKSFPKNDADDKAQHTAEGSETLEPDGDQVVIDYYRALIEEARQESMHYPDPDAARSEILQAKLKVIHDQVVRDILAQHTKSRSVST